MPKASAFLPPSWLTKETQQCSILSVLVLKILKSAWSTWALSNWANAHRPREEQLFSCTKAKYSCTSHTSITISHLTSTSQLSMNRLKRKTEQSLNLALALHLPLICTSPSLYCVFHYSSFLFSIHLHSWCLLLFSPPVFSARQSFLPPHLPPFTFFPDTILVVIHMVRFHVLLYNFLKNCSTCSFQAGFAPWTPKKLWFLVMVCALMTCRIHSTNTGILTLFW